jgi:hypothetical protein
VTGLQPTPEISVGSVWALDEFDERWEVVDYLHGGSYRVVRLGDGDERTRISESVTGSELLRRTRRVR